ncbi:3',5'-nucleoside bisphosphate phosphatase [Azonexus sp.]|jgi:predicted metal-dependent phosphoesterase TrpH|uniref:3',5'-nucleoside bisphosphate phosphatase n=1 Tax=Azonexus sp. TaxID=1872668 RepID=UPI002831C4F8|nr:3',5'-nucleoside bisphosphate phosphatase [Azonexus sp.]MDR1994798.1 PHP domain-containing protein [Azonexus sp.]
MIKFPFAQWLPFVNPVNFDFHCHSIVSDGLLPPEAVAQRAAANGVDLWALTDHDDLGGLAVARAAAAEVGIGFVNGVEISIEWKEIPIHIVGLGFDAADPVLGAGLDELRNGRIERAKRMGAALEAIGIPGVYEGALCFVTNPSLVSRAHFARYLVSIGIARDVPGVFQNYLSPGKPGYVDHRWATLADAVGWIHGAGGVAVVAHPGRYKMSGGDMRKFLDDFKDLGGQGIEVTCGSHSPDHMLHFARLARRYALHASRGSDFHGLIESYADLGKLPPLPEDLKPVWRLLR